MSVDCLQRGNSMLIYCDLFVKCWFPYHKHAWLYSTLHILQQVVLLGYSWQNYVQGTKCLDYFLLLNFPQMTLLMYPILFWDLFWPWIWIQIVWTILHYTYEKAQLFNSTKTQLRRYKCQIVWEFQQGIIWDEKKS